MGRMSSWTYRWGPSPKTQKPARCSSSCWNPERNRFSAEGAGADWETTISNRPPTRLRDTHNPVKKEKRDGSITSAKPKIANYAFTTLEPNLGIVSYYDEQSFVMADIPGIIEGAHEGKGIGIRFLRHIERNSVLLFMVSAEEEDINKGYETLLNELREYNPELLVKERVLAVTKCDLIDAKQAAKIEKKLPAGIPHVLISSVGQTGLNELKDLLWKALHS